MKSLRQSACKKHGARGGFVLLAILVFIFLFSMLTVSLLFRSQGEETAAAAGTGSEQAWSAAMSGVEVALQVAAAAAPGSIDWQDNPAAFKQRLVYEDGADQWYFTVYSPAGSDALMEVRYGLSDQASRYNLNHPGKAEIGKIPRVTEAMAAALHQYLGQPGGSNAAGLSLPVPAPTPSPPAEAADEALPSAATAPATLSMLGGAPSGPHQLATLDELMLVPGFTWPLVHGEDANMNGRLDANEDDGDETFPPDNHDGRLDHGMGQYFTVESYEIDRSNAGAARVNLNDAKAALPPGDFPAALTNYLAALHTANQKIGHPADLLEATAAVKNEQGIETQVSSGITKEELPRMLDLFTADEEGRHDGLININTASATVLATLPEVDAALAETIVSTRTAMNPDRRSSIAWLYQEGVVDAARFKALAPNLTARSYQFHFQVIGYGLPSGRYRVLEACIDVAGSQGKVTYLRDITRLGLPFALKVEAATAPAGEGAALRRSHPANPMKRHG